MYLRAERSGREGVPQPELSAVALCAASGLEQLRYNGMVMVSKLPRNTSLLAVQTARHRRIAWYRPGQWRMANRTVGIPFVARAGTHRGDGACRGEGMFDVCQCHEAAAAATVRAETVVATAPSLGRGNMRCPCRSPVR